MAPLPSRNTSSSKFPNKELVVILSVDTYSHLDIDAQETQIDEHSKELMVFVPYLQTIYENLGGVDFIQAPTSCILINGKFLIEYNGVVLEKVTYYLEVLNRHKYKYKG